MDSGAGDLITNHHSHLDTTLLLTSIPLPWRHELVVAAAADYFFDTRFKAALAGWAYGAVPMERKKVSRRSADRAADLLLAGWSLLVFPEGGRSHPTVGVNPTRGVLRTWRPGWDYRSSPFTWMELVECSQGFQAPQSRTGCGQLRRAASSSRRLRRTLLRDRHRASHRPSCRRDPLGLVVGEGSCTFRLLRFSGRA